MFKRLLRVHNRFQAVSTRKKKESGFRGVLAQQQEQASAREVSNDVLMDFMPPTLGGIFFAPGLRQAKKSPVAIDRALNHP